MIRNSDNEYINRNLKELIIDESGNLKPRMLLDGYKRELNYMNMPDFLKKYLDSNCLQRLKRMGYFCGMEYASSDVYDFKEYISRYDHSLTSALLTWKCSKNKCATISALFHDVATPCFLHAIDHIDDYCLENENNTKHALEILKRDLNLLNSLKEDNIDLEKIADFKSYSIITNDRPNLCVDRLDGIILSGISWTQSLNIKDVSSIVNNVGIYKDDNKKDELGFKNLEVANLIINTNSLIDQYCSHGEDFYMMELLSKIIVFGVKKKIIKESDLRQSDEYSIMKKLVTSNNDEITDALNSFYNIKYENVPIVKKEKVKQRVIKPIVNGTRVAA